MATSRLVWIYTMVHVLAQGTRPIFRQYDVFWFGELHCVPNRFCQLCGMCVDDDIAHALVSFYHCMYVCSSLISIVLGIKYSYTISMDMLNIKICSVKTHPSPVPVRSKS